MSAVATNVERRSVESVETVEAEGIEAEIGVGGIGAALKAEGSAG